MLTEDTACIISHQAIMTSLHTWAAAGTHQDAHEFCQHLYTHEAQIIQPHLRGCWHQLTHRIGRTNAQRSLVTAGCIILPVTHPQALQQMLEEYHTLQRTDDPTVSTQMASITPAPHLLLHLRRSEWRNNALQLLEHEIMYQWTLVLKGLSFYLRGLMSYTGNAQQGHYVCIARRAHTWYSFDDAVVTPLPLTDALKHGKSVSILLYSRVPEQKRQGRPKH